MPVLAWGLKLLQIVPQVTLALPEFKALWDQFRGGLKPADQETAKRAYELAISEAADAHEDLQDLVAQHTT